MWGIERKKYKFKKEKERGGIAGGLGEERQGWKKREISERQMAGRVRRQREKARLGFRCRKRG